MLNYIANQAIIAAFYVYLVWRAKRTTATKFQNIAATARRLDNTMAGILAIIWLFFSWYYYPV